MLEKFTGIIMKYADSAVLGADIMRRRNAGFALRAGQ
jgi:hypothetical protein